MAHLSQELAANVDRVKVKTRFGTVTGGRASTGAVVFLEIPFALPPVRWQDPEPLPAGFQYEDKEYIYESVYAAQPLNDGQSAGHPFQDKVGLGKPTENPLFVNIVIPPSFSPTSKFPVRVYVHGGFLQFGSPHGLGSQAQYVAAERNEIWVNMGYRLSAFGFLASDEPYISGNFGFKDQWLALEWVKENIAAFGGDPEYIRISGLSAGGHSVHQILHHASHLPEGAKAPFNSAVVQSNSIINSLKSPLELREQYHALCAVFNLDPSAPNTLANLRDPVKCPWEKITKAIDDDVLRQFSTFRGCLDNDTWLPASPDPMTWQRSGQFAANLRRVGVKSIVVGDLKEEWYLYGLAHKITSFADVRYHMSRYYPDTIIETLLSHYPKPAEDASEEELTKLFGVIMSDAQVHLPVRMLTRDLIASGFPVLRYEIRWTPEAVRVPHGYVTHGSDRCLWAYRVPNLASQQERATAKAWLARIEEEIAKMEAQDKPAANGNARVALTLTEEQTIEWKEDARFDELMKLTKGLPGEEQ